MFNAGLFNTAPLNSVGGAAPPDQTGEASGWLLGGIGSPAYSQVCVASSLEPGTVIPGAFRAQDQLVFSTGRSTTRFGNAIYRAEPDITIINVSDAVGFRATRLGVPNSPYAQAGDAEGWMETAVGNHTAVATREVTYFGSPRVVMVQPATGFQAFVSGMPAITRSVLTLGKLTAFGLPSSSLSNNAAGLTHTRFGRPSSRVTSHSARALFVGRRFGLPRARVGSTGAASGLSLTQFGLASAGNRQRVTHMAPLTQVGTPKLQRNPEC